MRELKLDEMKKIQIEILDVIDRFCKEHEIHYWIDCGTLLGAIRHKGYIPWDDDIDIGMLREDYDKFRLFFNQENTRYKFECIENNKNFYFAFGKVMDTNTELYEPDRKTGVKTGVYVDVFVYDNAPDDEKKCEKMFKKRDLYVKLRYAQLYPQAFDHSSWKKRIMRIFLNLYLKILPKNYYTKKIIKNSKKYRKMETVRVGNFTGITKFMGSKRIFDEFVEVEFEGKHYPAPIGYDEWLRNTYGDYMQLPPVEKRVSNHVFEAFIKDDEEY